jgi:hypothetical protein
VSHCHLLSAACNCRLHLLQLAGLSSHIHLIQLTVYLEFCWMPTPSLFSNVKSCQPIYSCRPCLFRVPVGKCPSPTLWPSMQHISHCYKPTPLHTRCGGSPFLPSLAGLFIYSLHGEVLLPLSPGAPPSLLCVFFQLLVYYSVIFFVLLLLLLFLLGSGLSFQGAMLFYPRGGYGSNSCHFFAHLLVCVSQAG